MKAMFVKDLSGYTGEAKLYQLEPPLDGNEYVVVSATYAMFSGPETYIFPATPDGTVTGWGELDGSFRGELDHKLALKNAGYEV